MLLVHGTLPPAHVRAVPWLAERRLSTRAGIKPDLSTPRSTAEPKEAAA